jgi:glycosyltransferase involved in cell wall biosynthesis
VDAPQVTVIIPTFNRLARLRRVLLALESQTVEPSRFEVVVVSDGSTDGTEEFLRTADTRLRLTPSFQANAGPAAARNRGVDLATGDLVLFVDDDVLAHPDLIAEHLSSHQQAHEPVVVVGPMLTPSDHRIDPFVRWEQAMLYKQYEAMARGDFEPTFRQFYTGNASLRRDLLVAAGPFDERFRRAEDIELAYRLSLNGARFVFNERAVGYHYATRSFCAWLQIAHDYGVNDVVLGRRQSSGYAFNTIHREFWQRHRLIRSLSRTCVSRPRLQRSLRRPIRAVASVSYSLGLEALGRQALSSLYNVTYYGGLASELGGREYFERLMDIGFSPTISEESTHALR